MPDNKNKGGSNQGKDNSSKRGLASADKATRERVAHMGGAAVSGNREHMSEIGRKGGERSHGNKKNNEHGNKE